jgi:hypothetical protein
MIEVEGKIDNQPIEILIDYGASHSYINSNIVEIFHLQSSKHKKSWLVEFVDTERGVNQYQVQFKTFFNLYLNHSTISNDQ